MGDVLRPHRHRPARGVRSRWSNRRRGLPQRAATRSSAPTTRPRSRSSWSWSRGTRARRPPPVGIELLLTVAEEQGLRGAKAFDASPLRSRVRLRPRSRQRGRRGDRHLADPAERARRLQRGRGACRDPSRGRQQRDRRCRGGDRPDGAGPPRRGDDRQRRRDPGRHLGQRRPRPLRDRRRGAQPRRGAGCRGGRRAQRRLRLGRERARLRRRRADRGALPRLPDPAVLAGAGTGGGGTAPGRLRARAHRDRRRQRRQRPDRRRLRLRPARQRHRRANHTSDETVSARNLDAMLEVCEGIVAEAAAGQPDRDPCRSARCGERPAEAAARRRRRRGAADGRDRRRAAPGLGRRGAARGDARGRRGGRQRRRRSTWAWARAASTSSTST